MEEHSSALKTFTGKYIGNRSLRKPRRNWEEKCIQICISKRNWVDLVQDRDYWIVLLNAEFILRFL